MILESIMEKGNHRSYKAERWTSREEERVWVGFYRRVNDPTVAADLLEQMEADSEVKARHLGLYLRCRQSLRQDKARRARARAVAHGCEALVRMLLRPLSVLRDLGKFAGDFCGAWTSTPDEPAVRQMRKIRKTQTGEDSRDGSSSKSAKQA
jgi:hypothetical protein